jgi:glycosyltransferase involved in cell wall biosynthesis
MSNAIRPNEDAGLAAAADAGPMQVRAAPRNAPALRVLMLGPDLQVRGGISAVESALLAALPREIEAIPVATMVEGSKWRKLVTFGQAIVKTMAQLRQRPDVVHIHFASRASSVRKMLLARLVLASGAKLIMHAHGGGYRDYWIGLSASGRAATLETLRRAHCLIVLGEAWGEFFAAVGVPREKIVVMPNPVALPTILPKRLARAQVRLVYLGLFARSKGVYDLIDALTRVSAECLARTRLVLAGNGEIKQVRELVERRGLQRVVEVRDWLAPAERDGLLASADAFVLPSYAEGLPMSLLEAMAWGLPVICTAVGSIPEHVHDGEEGILVRPGDVSELAEAIERLVMDEPSRVRMGGLARIAVEPLSIELYARQMASIYRAVARDGSAGAAIKPCTPS